MISVRFGNVVGASALLIATAFGAQAGADLDRIQSSGVMKVSTSLNWAPQSFLDENNKMAGFDIEVAKEIASRLGVTAEFVTPEWAIITAGSWNDRWDISVGSMTPTPTRAEVLDFPAVYYYTPAAFAVHDDSSAKTIADLDGKKIGAAINSTNEAYLRHELEIDAIGTPAFEYAMMPGEIVSMDQIGALLDDLRLGDGVRLDALLTSLPAVLEAEKAGYPIRALEDYPFYEPLAVAIDKGDAELGAKIAEIVQAMHDDGTLTTLSQKWYGIDYTSTN